MTPRGHYHKISLSPLSAIYEFRFFIVLSTTSETFTFRTMTQIAKVTVYKRQNTAKDLNLTYGPWQIHFSCVYKIEPDLMGTLGNKEVELPGQGVTVSQLQGDQYYLKPTQSFISLTPGGRRKIKLKIGYVSVARTDTMPNWYITLPNLKPEVLANTKGNLLDFVTARTTVQQWKRFGSDDYNPWTVQVSNNYIKVNKTVQHWTASNFLTVRDKLGIPSAPSSTSTSNIIDLSLGEVNATAANVTFNNSQDAYSLSVNATSHRIEVVGQAASGVFYGVVTLLSLLVIILPECIITDAPRFPYRGLMLDIARNFHPKEDILNIIKLMSSYKLNRLHLHLSDDEGWRINIPQLPELTTLGSQRCYDPTETKCLMPQLGSGPNQAGPPGSGFLTSADYIEILRLANAHHVTVIPEIEMPGHGRAAILSMKLRNSTQGSGGVSTVLAEANDPSEYTSPQMYSDNAINPCLESTYNFVNIIMTEVFVHRQQPLKIFHFGGDEVGKGAWVNSSRCQQLIASTTLPGGSLKGYFFQVNLVAELAANKSLSLAAWEDGLMDSEDNPFNLSTSPVKDVLTNAWNNVWQPGTVSRTYKFAEHGYKVILSHATHLYFDHPDEPDPEERGNYWATRFTALADRAWHKASWESLPKGDERNKQQKEDWFSFARAVGYRELPRLEQQNVTYRIPPPGAELSRVESFWRAFTDVSGELLHEFA
ncbi:unnamed protein product [Candidula unifasciata]|uniref:beta-N-acetylhexosaminidase n=1 Tax=Candidula unifasciata TaxID=100452 RepID=A0A8S3ZJQ8_9EUPU|nr:unnamed protein product [Candidula unifasciata]